MSNTREGITGILHGAIRDAIYHLVSTPRFGHPITKPLKDEYTLEGDLGLDSLDQVALLVEVENHFLLEIEDETAEKIVTVGDVVHLIVRAMERRAGC